MREEGECTKRLPSPQPTKRTTRNSRFFLLRQLGRRFGRRHHRARCRGSGCCAIQLYGGRRRRTHCKGGKDFKFEVLVSQLHNLFSSSYLFAGRWWQTRAHNDGSGNVRVLCNRAIHHRATSTHTHACLPARSLACQLVAATTGCCKRSSSSSSKDSPVASSSCSRVRSPQTQTDNLLPPPSLTKWPASSRNLSERKRQRRMREARCNSFRGKHLRLELRETKRASH